MLCYCETSLCVVCFRGGCGGLHDGGLHLAWILSENGCLRTLHTLFEQLEDSLDQLLIKAITKLCEKLQVCSGIVLCCLCVWESVSLTEKKRKR